MSTEDQAGRAGQAAPMTSRGATRRRLAKAGLGAAGVLWTTQAHATRVCVSPSAAMSSGLDSNKKDHTNLVCKGRSHGYWKNHGGWPVSPTASFGSVFTCSNKNLNTYGATPLQEIVEGVKFDKYYIGRELAVAFLNVKQGWISYLSEETLRQMWSELQSTGHYQASKGVYWDIETTKNYLESTHSMID